MLRTLKPGQQWQSGKLWKPSRTMGGTLPSFAVMSWSFLTLSKPILNFWTKVILLLQYSWDNIHTPPAQATHPFMDAGWLDGTSFNQQFSPLKAQVLSHLLETLSRPGKTTYSRLRTCSLDWDTMHFGVQSGLLFRPLSFCLNTEVPSAQAGNHIKEMRGGMDDGHSVQNIWQHIKNNKIWQ